MAGDWSVCLVEAFSFETRAMFRFTIRDVLWLMVVVALALGWWTEYRCRAVALITISGQGGHGIVLNPGATAVISADDKGILRTKTKGTR